MKQRYRELNPMTVTPLGTPRTRGVRRRQVAAAPALIRRRVEAAGRVQAGTRPDRGLVKRNRRAQAVRDLACKWDLRLGRDRGCHSDPFTCDLHAPADAREPLSYRGRGA